jgi:simple sugar transport system ATP-binding protein
MTPPAANFPPPAAEPPPVIRLERITKRFGGFTALDDVSLDIRGGEILGLLGENGAGKSTLMNVLAGLLRPSAGAVHIAGDGAPSAPAAGRRAPGIGMVHQHFKLVPALTVVENLRLFVRSRPAALRAAAADWLTRLRWSLPLDARVDGLSTGQQQRAEILKALLITQTAGAGGPAVLILDEPTAVLTPPEVAELFTALRTLRDAGAAVVFITHKLAEVQALCDRIAILRRGKRVHLGPAAALPADALAELMVGSRVELPHLSRSAAPPAAAHPVLELRRLSAGLLTEVSLQLRPGEIVGVAGVDGNGQSDLARALLGTVPLRAGDLLVGGEPAAGKPVRWRTERIACIAEDRHVEALVLPLSITENLLLKDYRKPPFSRWGWTRPKAWRERAGRLVRTFDVRCRGLTEAVGRLSGGNQQKVVLARELHDAGGPGGKPVVLAVNPTRGLDVGATAYVMQSLLDARARGAGVLLIHSDLDELLALADRVVVLFEGRLTAAAAPSKEAVGRLMAGLS